MSYYNEKPKNDFEKPKHYGEYADYTPTRERGGCMTALLALASIGAALGFVSICTVLGAGNRYSLRSPESSGVIMVAVLIGGALQLGAAGSLWAMWNWKRWGFYGFMGFLGVSMILSFCTGNMPQAIGSVVWLVMVAAVIGQRLDEFDES